MNNIAVTLLLVAGCSSAPQPLEPHELAYGALVGETLCIREMLMAGPAITNTATGCVSIDPDKMAHIAKTYGIEVVIAIWAHEFGHVDQFHKLGPTYDYPTDRKGSEQKADEHAGCALGRLGMSPYPVFKWLKKQEFAERIYGTLDERKEAILKGIERCTRSETN